METSGEFRMLPEAVAVAADVDDMTVMHEAIDERGSHDLIAEDLAPKVENGEPLGTPAAQERCPIFNR